VAGRWGAGALIAALPRQNDRAAAVPKVRRHQPPKPIETHLGGADRDVAIARAYREGQHSLSTIREGSP
jgi:hypothetical protein